MNFGYRMALWCGTISVTCLSLAAIEDATGIVSHVAPTETALLVWICVIFLILFTLKMMKKKRALRFGVKWPTVRYATRTRRRKKSR